MSAASRVACSGHTLPCSFGRTEPPGHLPSTRVPRTFTTCSGCFTCVKLLVAYSPPLSLRRPDNAAFSRTPASGRASFLFIWSRNPPADLVCQQPPALCLLVHQVYRFLERRRRRYCLRGPQCIPGGAHPSSEYREVHNLFTIEPNACNKKQNSLRKKAVGQRRHNWLGLSLLTSFAGTPR